MKARLKTAARAAVRRLVPVVSTRPWLVALASRAFALFPSVKLRLQRIMAQPLPSGARAQQLTDAQLRVLIDLRDAQETARGRGR
jgi:hypothetical protein